MATEDDADGGPVTTEWIAFDPATLDRPLLTPRQEGFARKYTRIHPTRRTAWLVVRNQFFEVANSEENPGFYCAMLAMALEAFGYDLIDGDD